MEGGFETSEVRGSLMPLNEADETLKIEADPSTDVDPEEKA